MVYACPFVPVTGWYDPLIQVQSRVGYRSPGYSGLSSVPVRDSGVVRGSGVRNFRRPTGSKSRSTRETAWLLESPPRGPCLGSPYGAVAENLAPSHCDFGPRSSPLSCVRLPPGTIGLFCASMRVLYMWAGDAGRVAPVLLPGRSLSSRTVWGSYT